MTPAEPIEIALAAVVGFAPGEEARVLIATRPEGALLGGYAELPGGKVEPGESPRQAAVRELREETGLAVCATRLEPLAAVSAANPARTMHCFLVRVDGDVGVAGGSAERLRWMRASALDEIDFPPANAAITRALIAAIGVRAPSLAS